LTRSILDAKGILTVNDEPGILKLLREEIRAACPNCKIDKATSYKEAAGSHNSSAWVQEPSFLER